MDIVTCTDKLLLDIDDSGIISRRFLGGSLCAYTAKSPQKDTGNEDAAGILECSNDSGVLIVADGLGGQPSGNRASYAAITELSRSVKAGCKENLSLRESVFNGIESANQVILDMATGSATTIIAARIRDKEIRSFHVGDSVALVCGQRGKIKLQTMPHSPTGYAVEAGLISEDEALHHDERHIISNAVGSQEMRIEIGPSLPLALRDTVLLGSDGLFDNLTLDEIVNIIRAGPLEHCARQLVATCQERMTTRVVTELHKPDDMTFILFRLT